MQQSAHPSIFHLSHPDIIRTKNIPRLFYAFSMLSGGAILFFLSFRINVETPLIPLCLLIAAVALILIAVYQLFWNSKRCVYVPDHHPLKETSAFPDCQTLEKVMELMVSKGCLVDRIDSVSKGMYYLVSLISKDKKFAALQLFLFAQCTYTPLSDVCFLYGDEVELLARM